MSEETLLSAARRVVRFVRINNERDGGLITNDTTWAVDLLARMIEQEDAKAKKERADGREDA